MRCQRAGAHVTLSYRRADFDATSVKFWLLPEIRSMIRDNRVRFLPNTRPVEIRRGGNHRGFRARAHRLPPTLFDMLGVEMHVHVGRIVARIASRTSPPSS